MTTYKRADLSRVTTISIARRKSTVTPGQFAAPFNAKGGSFREFAASLPDVLKSRDLRRLVRAVVTARRRRRPVLLLMGAHVIKVGLAPVIIDLLKKDVFTAVAMNSAASIHDVETAMWGRTSEDVAANLGDGTFGMARETDDFINGTLRDAWRTTDFGYGEALARAMIARKAPNLRLEKELT